MESLKKKEEEEENEKEQIDQIQEGMKDLGTEQDRLKYLESQMPGVRFTHEQKGRIQESLGDQVKFRETIKAILNDVKESKSGDSQLLKKIESIAPLYDSHEFWDDQPVPKAYEKVDNTMIDRPIDHEKTIQDIKHEPYNLPAGFYWSEVDIMNRDEATEVYDLLTQNYVEDDDNMFRFDYTVDFLQWALTPPNYFKNWLFGVRGGKGNKLFGFISGIPVHMNVRGK